MGIDRFEEGADDPSHEAKPDPPRDTGNPGVAGRSGETPSLAMPPAPNSRRRQLPP